MAIEVLSGLAPKSTLSVDQFATFASIPASQAANNSLFRSSDHSGALCWKDGSGTVSEVLAAEGGGGSGSGSDDDYNKIFRDFYLSETLSRRIDLYRGWNLSFSGADLDPEVYLLSGSTGWDWDGVRIHNISFGSHYMDLQIAGPQVPAIANIVDIYIIAALSDNGDWVKDFVKVSASRVGDGVSWVEGTLQNIGGSLWAAKGIDLTGNMPDISTYVRIEVTDDDGWYPDVIVYGVAVYLTSVDPIVI